MTCKSLQDVRGEEVRRASTGYPEVDWIYGYSTFSNGTFWGIPEGKISLWSGESGVGKSRMAIAMAQSFVRGGVRVLYFQNEVDETTFSGWAKRGFHGDLKNFFYSGSTALNDQIRDIEMIKPTIVFVDSINLIDEFKNGSKQDIKLIVDRYRSISMKLKTMIIFISQLNQDGSIKGSTTLSHLVDIALSLQTHDDEGSFILKVGNKHRYGRRGSQFYSLWKHVENGVQCLTDFRLEDDIWCRSHNLPIRARSLREIFPLKKKKRAVYS